MSVLGYSRLIYLFLFIINGLGKSSNSSCMPTITTCGYTVPSGDIHLRYGHEPLEIVCTFYQDMFPPNVTASSILFFKKGNVSIYPNTPYDILDESAERVEVLNSTSIRLVIKKPQKMITTYNCACNTARAAPETNAESACSNTVVVGIPPQNITDFKCIDDNWDKIFCSWTLPNNYAVTTYDVFYTFGYTNPHFCRYNDSKVRCHRHKQCDSKRCYKSSNITKHRPKPHKQVYNRTKKFRPKKVNNVTGFPATDNSDTRMNFTIGPGAGIFVESEPKFQFTIKMSNVFGNSTHSLVWNHFKNIIFRPPGAPAGPTGRSLSPSVINLKWDLSAKLPAFPDKLLYKITYKCNIFCDAWKEAPDLLYKPESAVKSLQYNLTHLEFAHVLYDIRVRVKVAKASDDTLSNYSSVVVKTLSKIPDHPPRTTIGSFQLENDEVYVYFQKIPPQRENGEGFRYAVESEPRLNMTELTSTYAKFVGLEQGTRYTMTIRSQNNVGNSTGHSVVYIPSKPAKRPMRLWTIEHSSTEYELEWKPPPNKHEIMNYTLFWCEQQKVRPHPCDGLLNWTVIPNHLTKYNVTVRPTNQVYQFAIAANGANGSSGMLWSSCTLLTNRRVQKINQVIIKSGGPNFIELNWSQECFELNSDVVGYVIYYCTTNNDEIDVCDSPMRNVTINATLSEYHSENVTGLLPYRTYLLAVSAKTATTIGARSDFVRNITSEAAPSTPPLDVEDIPNLRTNSSVTIRWKPPTELNGKLERYIIKYNDRFDNASSDASNHTLRGLDSYKNYKVSVSACTKFCSAFSHEIDVFTKMGVPDAPSRPFVDSYDDDSVTISWSKPHNPRGTVKYYQIVVAAQKDEIAGDVINGTDSEVFSYRNCRADGEPAGRGKYIRVRAVNEIGNEHYPGEWSEPLNITNCNLGDNLTLYFVVIGIVVALVALVCITKRVYDKCAVMKRLEVVLPPGLASLEDTSEKGKTDINRFYPDEELLLDKIAEKCPTRDSSGCSSGQESITSSNESTAHLSIDSGTDQTRSVADEKENSLRLRNVSSKGYVLHDPTPTVNRGTKPAPNAPANYIVLGVDPAAKPAPDASSPYVTVSDGDAPNDKPPAPDFFKTPNPGYVPFSNAPPAGKNAGYVLAGDLSLPAIEPKATAGYVEAAAAAPKPVAWQQPAVEPSLTKPGYVSVGEAPAPVKEAGKGYVPHRQFEVKSLKED
ncbi:unnamed protein product [Phyllotreta striolata]|uniref:Fibronectin type-III domain-containing protein n=1 Tax=Phyllotreta striolata TaxID=444603 RepID=A0A9N9XKV0_PHYSR|nr:unnamed protein product [Phyllotreta striolata]